MKFIVSVLLFLSFCTFVTGQGTPNIKWYSETTTNGIRIQNSFPKGGSYNSTTGKNFNYSYLIFFTRIVNETAVPLELKISFPADSFAIPSSPNTFLKIFLPPDTMTLEKEPLFNYGFTGIESFLDHDKPTLVQRTIGPKEEVLFYIGTVFYQTKKSAEYQPRGGNRAELVLKDHDLFFRMIPQIDLFSCGHIILKK